MRQPMPEKLYLVTVRATRQVFGYLHKKERDAFIKDLKSRNMEYAFTPGKVSLGPTPMARPPLKG